jgi:hypothetical protein
MDLRMKTILRTLLISDKKNGQLVYGHSIRWGLLKLDYTINKWSTYNAGSLSVFFKDLAEDQLRPSLEQGYFNLNPDIDFKIHFNFSETDTFFLEKSYEENNFNPFIGLCTSVTAHFQEFARSDIEIIEELHRRKDLLEVIREKYDVDLLKHPHLVGTFLTFEPTRIEEYCRAIETEQAIGYQIALTDTLNLYEGATVTIEAIANDKTHVEEFGLDLDIHIVDCGFMPDSQKVLVEHNGAIIYKSSYGFFKKLTVNTAIVGNKQIAFGGKLINQTQTTKNERHE